MNLYKAHFLRLKELFESLADRYSIDEFLIPSGDLIYREGDDQSYPFWVNPYFVWCLPFLKKNNVWLRFKRGAEPELILLKEEDFWHDSVVLPELATFWKLVYYTSPPELNENIQVVTPKLKAKWLQELAWYRGEKTDFEISLLDKANCIAAKGHQVAKDYFENGASELEIHWKYMEAVGQREVDLPYGNIIAINEKAAVLHSSNYRPTVSKPKVLLVDAGVSVGGYGSDITRTSLHSSHENSIFATLLQEMDSLQKNLCNSLQIGMSFLDLHIQCYESIATLLCEFGLYNGSVDDCINEKIVSVFFPHGLGHLLGVQTHDVGGYFKDKVEELPKNENHPYLRCARTIQKNMVVTIEPGLYFIPSLLENCPSSKINKALVEELKPYGGIRIEDNIYLGSNGELVNLTRKYLNI